MLQRLILVLPLTLGSTFLTRPTASAAECARWVTQCTNTCTQQDEYGSCTAWSQNCTQVCGEWTNDPTVTEKATTPIDDALLQRFFTQVVSRYPKDAKSMTWHIDKQEQIVIEDVKR